MNLARARWSLTLWICCSAACQAAFPGSHVSPAQRDAEATPLSDESSTSSGDVDHRSTPGVELDAGAMGVHCPCAPGQVLASGACVATVDLGCTQPCEADDCGPGRLCAEGAAALCGEDGVAPACTSAPPSIELPSGALRVWPTHVQLGQTVTLRVEGSPFYIGALWWEVRVDDHVSGPAELPDTPCVLQTTWTPSRAGVFAVTARYGSGPSEGDLAGFVQVHADAAGLKPLAQQPGWSCSASQPCAQGDGWVCACAVDRCVCEPAP